MDWIKVQDTLQISFYNNTETIFCIIRNNTVIFNRIYKDPRYKDSNEYISRTYNSMSEAQKEAELLLNKYLLL